MGRGQGFRLFPIPGPEFRVRTRGLAEDSPWCGLRLVISDDASVLCRRERLTLSETTRFPWILFLELSNPPPCPPSHKRKSLTIFGGVPNESVITNVDQTDSFASSDPILCRFCLRESYPGTWLCKVNDLTWCEGVPLLVRRKTALISACRYPWMCSCASLEWTL